MKRIASDTARLVAASPRIAKILWLSFLRRSDYKRWSDAGNLEEWWVARTEKIVGLIPPHARVIEFGAGRKQLETRLDKSCVYFASDLVDRGPGTIICDLNKRPLPDVKFVAADVAVFSGVLEYIRDLDSLVEWLSGQVAGCVASYECFDPASGPVAAARQRLRRLYYGYMNHLSEKEFVGTWSRHRFSLAETVPWENQRIFRFVQAGDLTTCAAGGDSR
jgi:hypothetical protein